MKCQNPEAKPTRKQTWAVFCMTKQDIRGKKYTRGEVSQIISDLKSKGKAVAPDGEEYFSKNGNGSTSSNWATDLVAKAEEAGQKAMDDLIKSKKVKPMIVEQHVNQLDDNSPVEQSWVVDGGPCGFAFVRVKCTNGPSRKFINELKKKGLAGGQNDFKDWSKSDYYGGFLKSFVLEGGQSLAYKQAYARAYAEVLEAEGINIMVFSRMD